MGSRWKRKSSYQCIDRISRRSWKLGWKKNMVLPIYMYTWISFATKPIQIKGFIVLRVYYQSIVVVTTPQLTVCAAWQMLLQRNNLSIAIKTFFVCFQSYVLFVDSVCNSVCKKGGRRSASRSNIVRCWISCLSIYLLLKQLLWDGIHTWNLLNCPCLCFVWVEWSEWMPEKHDFYYKRCQFSI